MDSVFGLFVFWGVLVLLCVYFECALGYKLFVITTFAICVSLFSACFFFDTRALVFFSFDLCLALVLFLSVGNLLCSSCVPVALPSLLSPCSPVLRYPRQPCLVFFMPHPPNHLVTNHHVFWSLLTPAVPCFVISPMCIHTFLFS